MKTSMVRTHLTILLLLLIFMEVTSCQPEENQNILSLLGSYVRDIRVRLQEIANQRKMEDMQQASANE